jgi:anti-sigma factor RsiW
VVFSRYLEGDLDARRRSAFEAHLGDCPRCGSQLASLENTLGGLGSLEQRARDGLADSIVAALRAEAPHPAAATSKKLETGAGAPALALVTGSTRASAGGRFRRGWPREARSALRWCLQRPQLILTLPIALLTGVVLSMVNMGGMLMHGKIDLGVCVSCAIDFLVPFLALNVGLLMVLWVPRRGGLLARRCRSRRRRDAWSDGE